MRRGPSIGRLLVGVNAFVLFVPVLALVLLRIYESHLVEQTERRLIGEAVVVAEAWREMRFEAKGEPLPLDARVLPPTKGDARFWSIRPTIKLSDGLTEAAPEPVARQVPGDPAAQAAGKRLEPLLNRVKRFNLSAVRVLDAHGCVVASTSAMAGDECLGAYPEVRRALGGHYGAVARRRHTDHGRTSPTGISRGGSIRVFVAVPIFYEGKVIGVVRMARTSLDTVEALWRHKRTLAWAALACLLMTLGVSWYLTRRIGRPVRAISAAARAISRGEPQTLRPTGKVPAEVADMSESLDQMTLQLSRRGEYIREFAATVSHELKTPIAGIRGATELLSESWDTMTAEQRQRFIGNIDAGALRMQALVSRLLELARIENAPERGEAGGGEVSTFGPGDAVRALVASYSTQVSVTVGKDAPAALTMRADHFDSAVGNLIDNALAHGAEPVEVTLGRANGRLLVRVRDRGAGVSEGNRGKVFERFFTTARDDGGTGLGLAIVKAVADTRGGSLSYDREGDWTVFRLVL